MNYIKKAMICAAAAGAATLANATPVVSNVTMAQGLANRQVTITYSVSEDAVVTLDVQTNATPNAATGWVSIGGVAICNAKGDVWKKVEAGSRTITWRPDLSWTDENGNGFNIANGCAKAIVTAYALDNTPDYMVVDLSSAAQPNTQKYYPAADFLPGGLLGNSDYRTTSLVMRKINAKDIEWTMGSTTTTSAYSRSRRTSGRQSKAVRQQSSQMQPIGRCALWNLSAIMQSGILPTTRTMRRIIIRHPQIPHHILANLGPRQALISIFRRKRSGSSPPEPGTGTQNGAMVRQFSMPTLMQILICLDATARTVAWSTAQAIL